MSVTAVGVTTDLDGPLPVPRRFSLLNTPGVVVEQVGEGENPRWLSGVNVVGYPAGVPHTWEPCTTGTMRVKESVADLFDEEDDDQPQARFDPIAVYFPLTCSSIGQRNPDRLAERAKKVLDATLSFGVEKAISQGVFLSNNPNFSDSNTVALAGGTAVSPQVGLSYLENAIGIRTGRQGVIHSTPAVTAAWGFGAGLSDDPIDEPAPEAVLRTANGTPVISGAGYIGARPVGQPGLGPTEDWVFATGQIEVRIGDGPRMDITESLDRTINEITFRAERFVLADWDTSLQVGVLIDWAS
jgi:hypothetical protein